MSLLLKAFRVVAIMGFFVGVFADTEGTAVKITDLKVITDGRVIIWVSGNTPCTCNGYAINMGGTNGQAMYQAALSAYNTGTTVELTVSSTPCSWGTYITAIHLMPN